MWYLISAIIFFIIVYVLFAPLIIEVNSTTNLYSVRFHRLISVKLIILGNFPKLEIRIAGVKREINLFVSHATKKTSAHKVKTHQKNISFGKIRGVMKTFKIKEWKLSIDTGNEALNGFLFPCFLGLSRLSGHPFNINFLYRNEIIFRIENNIARIIRAYIIS